MSRELELSSCDVCHYSCSDRHFVCASSCAVRSHTCCIIDKYEDQSAINQTFQNIKHKKKPCTSENCDSL